MSKSDEERESFDSKVFDKENKFTNEEKDLLGEIGNICMGNASTIFSKLLQKSVTITTPNVEVVRSSSLEESFIVPHIALKVKYSKGIDGDNILVINIKDAIIIADIMMGGDGKSIEDRETLNELEISAVSEAMNQMIASSATSMSTMFQRTVDITTPKTIISYDESEKTELFNHKEDKEIVKIEFDMNVSDLIQSKIVQILSIDTAKNIVDIMFSNNNGFTDGIDQRYVDNEEESKYYQSKEDNNYRKNANISDAVLSQLDSFNSKSETPNNINLILDVPLEISVLLGKTKQSIGEILNLGTGSLVELEKLAEEPVDILVNGKHIAKGEVVVVNENFGVRITSIISNSERVKNLNL